MRDFVPFILGLIIMLTSGHAADPILFVSAFDAKDRGAIQSCRFDPTTGQLDLLHRMTDVENPFFLVVSADSRFLYSIDSVQFGEPDDEFVAAFQILGQTGQLKKLNRQSARGTASCYLDIDPTGRSVLVANYSSGSVAALPVHEDGSLGEARSFIPHAGTSVNPGHQQPRAHSIVVSPDARFALAADLGLDKILGYRFDAAASALVANTAQPLVSLPPGSGPRHLTFHPNGKHVYVINETQNTVAVFDYSLSSGTLHHQQTLSTLPDSFSGVSHTADLKITPDGQFLYGTNRGHDSIAMYRIAADGQLDLVGIESSLGPGPQNLLISSDGRWLLCANMPGSTVVVFAIDSKTGHLTATADPYAVPMPACLRWLH